MTTMIVELRAPDRPPGLVGLGEGYPDAYYGETPTTMPVVMDHLLGAGRRRATCTRPRRGGRRGPRGDRRCVRPGDPGPRRREVRPRHRPSRSRRQGDRRSPSIGSSGSPPPIPPTDFTLGLDEPAVVAERARRAARFPALKIKLGGPADLATLEAVRCRLRRARSGWMRTRAGRRRSRSPLLPELVRLGVELIEQPFPPRRYDWLRDLQAASSLPIVADESAVDIEDLDAPGRARRRGQRQARQVRRHRPGGRMLARARELGFRTFLGCMEETIVGIAASAAVASLAEWVDLDGCLLLADDPFEGLELGAGLAVAARRPAGPGPRAGRRAALSEPPYASEGASRPQVSPGVRGLSTDAAGVWTSRWSNFVDKALTG